MKPTPKKNQQRNWYICQLSKLQLVLPMSKLPLNLYDVLNSTVKLVKVI